MNRDDLVIRAIREKDIQTIISSFFDKDKQKILPGYNTETELWDYKRQLPDSNLEWAEISKDILGFYNTKKGGLLIFGIDDQTYSIYRMSTSLNSIDNKVFNDKIRKYIGDKIWVEFFYMASISIAIIPPSAGIFERFKCNGPEKNKKCLFLENGSAIRKHDSTYLLSPKDASIYSIDQKTVLTYNQYEIDEQNYRLLRREYSEFVFRPNLCLEIAKGLKNKRISVVSLIGIGGVGKTALASWAVMNSYKSMEYNFIVSLSAKDRELVKDGIRPITQLLTSIDDLLNSILDVLGFSDYKTADDKESIVRTLLNDENGLLFVDNLETTADKKIIDFLNDLPSGVKAIVTSRRNVIRVSSYPIDVGPMNDDESIRYIELLSRTQYEYCKSLTTAEKEQIGISCNKIPLAIKWLISRSQSISELLRQTSMLSESHLTGNELLEFSFRRVFDNMNAYEKQVISVLAIMDDMTLEAVVKGSGLDSKDVFDAIETLSADSLIYKSFDENINDYRYSILPFINQFVLHHCITIDIEKKIRQRLKTWYEAEDILDEEERILRREMRQGNKNVGDTLINFAEAAILRGDTKTAKRFYISAISRDPKNWKVYRSMGEYYRHTERIISEALRYYELALTHEKTASVSDYDKSILHREYALIYAGSGNPDATDVSINHLELAHKLSPNDAIVVNLLAQLYIKKGSYNTAINILEPFSDAKDKKTKQKLWPLLEEAYKKHGGKMFELARIKAKIQAI